MVFWLMIDSREILLMEIQVTMTKMMMVVMSALPLAPLAGTIASAFGSAFGDEHVSRGM